MKHQEIFFSRFGFQAHNRIESGAEVDAEFLTFSSGLRVALRHITSVKTVDFSTDQKILAFTIFCLAIGATFPIYDYKSTWVHALPSAILLLVSFYIMNMPYLVGVILTSSSGEEWMIKTEDYSSAASYNRELQEKIFDVNHAVVADVKVQKNEYNSGLSAVEEIEKLVEMRGSGVISEEEYLQLKNDILNRSRKSA